MGIGKVVEQETLRIRETIRIGPSGPHVHQVTPMTNFIPGRKPVIEALKAGTPIEKILLLAGIQGNVITEIRSLANKKNVAVIEASRQEFRQYAGGVTTQGVLAIIPSRTFSTLETILDRERNQRGFVLILDQIEDPHNLGALIRTAECAGVHGIVVPKHHAASITNTVVKSSAGATEHVAIAEVTNVVSAIERLKALGYWIVGLDEKGDKFYTEVDYTTSIALVVGNEGKGMRRLVKEHCDFLVRIPLFGKIESLNASVAGGLVLYEVVKQRTRG
jgi:23S rRNA (guanosine2251-2'-O)-methyltransferase